MANRKEVTYADLYTTESPARGLVIMRLNPDIDPQTRLDVVAQTRLDRLSAAIGQDAAALFTKEEILNP
jgi:hypothetical protein